MPFHRWIEWRVNLKEIAVLLPFHRTIRTSQFISTIMLLWWCGWFHAYSIELKLPGSSLPAVPSIISDGRLWCCWWLSGGDHPNWAILLYSQFELWIKSYFVLTFIINSNVWGIYDYYLCNFWNRHHQFNHAVRPVDVSEYRLQAKLTNHIFENSLDMFFVNQRIY